MREELFRRLEAELRKVEGVAHVDMWNQNVVFIDEETAWERPAVFIELGTVAWESTKEAEWLRGSVEVTLHIVTDWVGDREDRFKGFRLSKEIRNRLQGLRGGLFGTLTHCESRTDHDHAEIVETVDVYRCRGVERIEN